MFDPTDVDRTVETLSGGEKNRLMLARVLAKPGNFLILDEPTNDLDMDTLDMLEEILSKYQGTLFIVSHDRDFLDQTVSQILAFEGNTEIKRIIGGYSDYLEYVEKTKSKSQNAATSLPTKDKPAVATISKQSRKTSQKMSYKDKYELEHLPQKWEKVEEDIKALNKKLADPDFYKSDPDAFHAATKELADQQARLERYETRWLELEELKMTTQG